MDVLERELLVACAKALLEIDKKSEEGLSDKWNEAISDIDYYLVEVLDRM